MAQGLTTTVLLTYFDYFLGGSQQTWGGGSEAPEGGLPHDKSSTAIIWSPPRTAEAETDQKPNST